MDIFMHNDAGMYVKILGREHQYLSLGKYDIHFHFPQFTEAIISAEEAFAKDDVLKLRFNLSFEKLLHMVDTFCGEICENSDTTAYLRSYVEKTKSPESLYGVNPL